MSTALVTGPQKHSNGQGSKTSIFVWITTALCCISPVNQGINVCLLYKLLTDNSTLEWTIGLRSESVAIQN
jgi:hypothetical protein